MWTHSAPSGIVNDLQPSKINFTSITVTWQPVSCLQQNGVITHYNFRYTESSASHVASMIQSTTIISFTASSMYPGTSYTLEVAAVNSNGIGPYTQHVVSTLLPRGKCLSDSNHVNVSYVTTFLFAQMLDFLKEFCIQTTV